MKKNNYKNLKILKIHSTQSKAGVVRLKLSNGATLTKANGFGYDKIGACFYDLFKLLGCDVSNVDEYHANLFEKNFLQNVNDFLKKNRINYKANYLTQVNDKINFIELEKID